MKEKLEENMGGESMGWTGAWHPCSVLGTQAARRRASRLDREPRGGWFFWRARSGWREEEMQPYLEESQGPGQLQPNMLPACYVNGELCSLSPVPLTSLFWSSSNKPCKEELK